MQVGTTISVENLFFNTPVRYKFLKQDITEYRYIKDWVQKVALANPNISFRLLNDGKSVFFTNGKRCPNLEEQKKKWQKNKRKFARSKL